MILSQQAIQQDRFITLRVQVAIPQLFLEAVPIAVQAGRKRSGSGVFHMTDLMDMVVSPYFTGQVLSRGPQQGAQGGMRAGHAQVALQYPGRESLLRAECLSIDVPEPGAQEDDTGMDLFQQGRMQHRDDGGIFVAGKTPVVALFRQGLVGEQECAHEQRGQDGLFLLGQLLACPQGAFIGLFESPPGAVAATLTTEKRTG